MAALHHECADVTWECLCEWMTYFTPHNYMAALHCICADVTWECPCDWMTYYNPHIYMAAPHCVRPDVPLDHTSDWMNYYTYRRYMGDLHCVCVGVSLDCISDWKTYYTCHKYIGNLHYVCIDVPWEYTCDWKILYTHHRYTCALHYVCADVQLENCYAWNIYYTPHNIWVLSIMHAFMCLEGNPVTKWPIAHITCTWPHSSIVCMRWCTFRISLWLNDLLHTSHTYGRSPVCMQISFTPRSKPEITQPWNCYVFCYQHAETMHRLRLAGCFLCCVVHVYAGHFRYKKIIP